MSTSAINPGLSSLLQTLGNVSPSLSTPAVQTALQNASPQDIVAISSAALQAQNASILFGAADSSSNAFDPASLLSNLVQSASGTSGTTAQPASLQSLLAALQYQQVQGLFGSGTTSGSSTSVLG